MNFFKVPSQKNVFKSFLDGERELLFNTFNSLKDADRKTAAEISESFTKIIIENRERRNVIGIIHKLYELRGYSYIIYNYPLDTDFDRLFKMCGKNIPSVLIAGMCHPNGYVREKCVRYAENFPVLLPILLVMLNDSVREVRAVAEEIIIKLIPKADMLTLMITYSEADILSKKQRFDRKKYSLALSEIGERIRNEADEDTVTAVFRGLISSVRSYSSVFLSDDEADKIHRALFKNKILSVVSAKRALTLANSGFRRGLEFLYVTFYELSDKELISFTDSASPRIRKTAALKLCEKSGLWEGAEKLLTDKSRAVREVMIYHFKKTSDTDIRRFYTDRLPCPEAIKGLGECGNGSDEVKILSLVSSEDSHIAEAALYALFCLSGDEYAELFYKMITDERKNVSKTAYRMFRASGAVISPKRIYEDILKSRSDGVTAKRLVNILCSERVILWEKMPYLIRLYNFGTGNFRADVPKGMNGMNVNDEINRRIRLFFEKRERSICYALTDKKLSEDILAALSEVKLPRNTLHDILCQIGIRKKSD